jgi:hypothetical protein
MAGQHRPDYQMSGTNAVLYTLHHRSPDPLHLWRRAVPISRLWRVGVSVLHVLPGYECADIVIQENVEQLPNGLKFLAESSPECHVDVEADSSQSDGRDCPVRYKGSATSDLSCTSSLTPCGPSQCVLIAILVVVTGRREDNIVKRGADFNPTSYPAKMPL